MKTLTIKELKEKLDLASGGDDSREVWVDIEATEECPECDHSVEMHRLAQAIDVESDNPVEIKIICD